MRRPTARAGARACVAATLARVCRAAEQERERAEFFWQRLGRCATWREGSPVTRAQCAPSFFARAGFAGSERDTSASQNSPEFPSPSPSPPTTPFSLSLKQNKTQVVVLQNIYFFGRARFYNFAGSRYFRTRARLVFSSTSKLSPSKASFRLASTFRVAANASSS